MCVRLLNFPGFAGPRVLRGRVLGLLAAFFFLAFILTRPSYAADKRILLWNQGTREYRAAQYDQAILTFAKLIQLRNENGTPYFREAGLYLGTLRAKKGDFPQAYQAWATADLKLSPHDTGAPEDLLNRIDIKGISSSPLVRKCAQILVSYMQESPDSDSSMVASDGMVELLRRLGKTSEAQEMAHEAQIFREAANAAAEKKDFVAQILARAEVYRRFDREEYAETCEGKVEDLEDSQPSPRD